MGCSGLYLTSSRVLACVWDMPGGQPSTFFPIEVAPNKHLCTLSNRNVGNILPVERIFWLSFFTIRSRNRIVLSCKYLNNKQQKRYQRYKSETQDEKRPRSWTFDLQDGDIYKAPVWEIPFQGNTRSLLSLSLAHQLWCPCPIGTWRSGGNGWPAA